MPFEQADKAEIMKMIADCVAPTIAEAVKASREKADEEVAKAKETAVKKNEAFVPAFAQPLPTIPVVKADGDLHGSMKFAQYIMSLHAKKLGIDPIAYAKGARCHDDVIKALSESTLAGGGALVPPTFVAEVIEALKARSVVRRAGVRTLQGGKATLPFVSTGATAGYVGESTAVNATALTMGQLNLTAKKILAIVPASNELLRHSLSGGIMGVDALIRDDLVRGFAAAEDSAFLRGSGTANTPKGARNWAPTANVNARHNAASTGSTLAERVEDVCTMLSLVETANIDIGVEQCAFVMAPRTKWNLYRVLDSNGNYVFRTEMDAGRFMGFPFFSTSNIPTNLTTVSTVGSELIFAAWSMCLILDDLTTTIDVLDGAAYNDVTGALVSGASRDESIIRASCANDFGCRMRGAEVSVLTTLDANW